MRHRLPETLAVITGILTLLVAGLIQGFFLVNAVASDVGTSLCSSCTTADRSQASTHADVAIFIGLAAGLGFVWWATTLVLEDWVMPRRERAWVVVVGTALALGAVVVGLEVSPELGLAVVLPLGAVWGHLLKRVAGRLRA